MSPTEAQEELEEVQSDLRKREDEVCFKKIYEFLSMFCTLICFVKFVNLKDTIRRISFMCKHIKR